MDVQAKMSALIELAGEVGISIRWVPSAGQSPEHPGGALVRLKGREVLFLDPTSPEVEQADVLASALAGRAELEDRYLRPQVRELLDRASPGGLRMPFP